jgi:hypothetical protein
MRRIADLLLESDQYGELNRKVQVFLGAASLLLAAASFLVVRHELPASAVWAQFALFMLFLGATSGFLVLFTVLLKLWQRGRGRVIRDK